MCKHNKWISEWMEKKKLWFDFEIDFTLRF